MQDDIYQEIARLKAEGQEAALVTVISTGGSTPRKEGTKMLVRDDGTILGTIGGGRLEEQVTKEALVAIRKGQTNRLTYHLEEGGEAGMICGGDLEVFIEPILSTPTLFIFGGGHIALALTKIAKLVGFKIVVIDDRPEFATPMRFPEAEQTLAADFGEAFSKLDLIKSSYIVIVTYQHKGDEVALESAVKTEARYVGMIGSRNKNRVLSSHLLAKGIPQELLDRVHAPIGLSINAQTSEEIAVGILAEIILVRRSQLEVKS
ncbi:XdhC family protein [Chloroflexota bacterium]